MTTPMPPDAGLKSIGGNLGFSVVIFNTDENFHVLKCLGSPGQQPWFQEGFISWHPFHRSCLRILDMESTGNEEPTLFLPTSWDEVAAISPSPFPLLLSLPLKRCPVLSQQSRAEEESGIMSTKFDFISDFISLFYSIYLSIIEYAVECSIF